MGFRHHIICDDPKQESQFIQKNPMSNRLAHETSLYLQQHAENPVDWYPWGVAEGRCHAELCISR